MGIYLGKKGLKKTWQEDFTPKTKCVHCNGDTRIGFVYHEDADSKIKEGIVCSLHKNKGGSGGGYWLHDACSVAIYFCKKCLKPTALYNQA